MPSTYSPDLRIELIANGEKTGTWGTITNDNLGVIIEDAIAGLASVSVGSVNVDLNGHANYALTAQNGAADQARCAAISLTTTTTAPFNVYVPPVTKLYVIQNASSYTATVYASTVLGNITAAGSGTAIPAGRSVLVRCDGTNVFDQFNHVVNNMSFGGNVSVAGNASITGTTTLVGAATAPTPSNTDDSTNIATTAFVRDIIPSGLISMWSGTIATIPSGWLLCDGSNSTPDLRNRFIIGANADDAGVAKTNITGSPTQTGGTKDAIVVSHTHTATVTDPGHKHRYRQTGNSTGVSSISRTGLSSAFTDSDDLLETSTTGISVSNNTAGSSGTNANLNPYYALAFIMKA
jgi:hypothetical protein